MNFKRITVNPKQMDGVACIRGARIPVATVIGMMADGMTNEEILQTFYDVINYTREKKLCGRSSA